MCGSVAYFVVPDDQRNHRRNRKLQSNSKTGEEAKLVSYKLLAGRLYVGR